MQLRECVGVELGVWGTASVCRGEVLGAGGNVEVAECQGQSWECWVQVSCPGNL